MNRKSNPWVAIVALILLLVLVVCTCTGCADTTEAAEEKTDRFTIEKAKTNNVGVDVRVITDTETGVQYLYVDGGYCYGAGLIKLEEGEG